MEEYNHLQNQINELNRLTAFPLRRPLDTQSKQLIRELAIFPVSVQLKNAEPATAANYAPFFISDRSMIVVAVSEVHGTAGTDAGAVTLQIERLQGTEAPDAGDTLLASALSLKTTANTVQYATLVGTDVIRLGRGDRLCLKDAGTLTSVANLIVTVYLRLL